MLPNVCLSGVGRIMSSPSLRRLFLLAASVVLMSLSGWLSAQTSADVSTGGGGGSQAQTTNGVSKDPNSPEYDKRNKGVSEKVKKQQQRDFNKEVSKMYKKWLDEDVKYIITDEERAAFK